MLRIILFSIVILLMLSCTDSEKEEKLAELKVTVIQGSYHATLLWGSPSGNQVISYRLFLDDSLVGDHLSTGIFRAVSLKSMTEYKGRVEGYAGSELIALGSFKFTTTEDLPPVEFSIRSMLIGNHSVELEWEAAADPEAGPVFYDIYLNEHLVASDLDSPQILIEELSMVTGYQGKIVERDSAGHCRELPFHFNSIQHDHSILAHEYLIIQNRLREFCWYLPKSYPAAGNLPLVIFLHGANGNAWNEIQTSYYKILADQENFIFLMPQALKGTFNGSTLYQWNAHYIFPWDDAAFIGMLIDYLNSKFKVDLDRVYLSGMSNGGFMTFFAARDLQDRIAAIAPIAGLFSMNVFQNYTLSRPMPLCYMHGTEDNIVVMNGSPSLDEILDRWRQINGCSFSPEVIQLPDISTSDHSTVTLHRYSGDAEILFYEIIGGGHSIPGNEPGANMDINAFVEIWKFFSRQSLKGG